MKLLFTFAMMGVLAPHASAGPVVGIYPPEVYVPPGSSTELEVRLDGAAHLAGFYLEVGLSPQPGSAGLVAFTGATGDDDPRYCFHGMNDLFQSLLAGSDLLVVGDQTDPPTLEVTTVAGVNDLLAVIQIDTSPDAWGAFDVTVDAGVVELFDRNNNDIPDFGQMRISGATIIVPEPASLGLVCFALALLRVRRPGARRARRASPEVPRERA